MEQKIEMLKAADEYIIKLINGLKSAVDFFKGGKETKGAEIITIAVEGFEWLTNAINLTSDIQKEKIDISEVNDKLSEIVDGFENEDYVLVSDLLEYEIIPLLNTWKEKIQINF